MIFYTWIIELKLMLNAKFNYKKLTNEYLQNNRRKAAEEIKHLEDFTHWPIAKAKNETELTNQKNNLARKKKETKLHYLPFYPYQRKPNLQKHVTTKTENKVTNIDKTKKNLS